MRRVGIFGGTFDPPHVGHMILAKEVQLEANLDEIWFIPTNEPPHKSGVAAPPKERFAMIDAMIREEPTWKAVDLELQRKGKSYTIDTMKTLREEYPTYVFHFIIGADMVEFLPKWHGINELMNLVSFICVQRPMYTVQSPFPIKEVYVPEMNVSSTMIRERLQSGRDPHYFVPRRVYNYIKEHELYGYRTDQI